MQTLELLAPAKNLECGIAAIDHGADAVYIGASRFGARAAAGNSTEDIGALCKYAHQFGAKVFVTVNTIIYDYEISDTISLVKELDNVGVDAILVQDMGLYSLLKSLPLTCKLHASTQTDNRTTEKVKWLKQEGFSRVVLARELSIEEIRKIHDDNPDVELEVFVHGALCVSYSGQCYASQYCFGRSANRGECAQFCRLKFTLKDANNNVLEMDRHLLSLKDMAQLNNLERLADAGAVSFKIEGRLKDIDYVKNITAAYSEKLNEICRKSPDKYQRASFGKCQLSFTPSIEKSFNRGFTTYFADGRKPNMVSFDTPKAMGERVGKVKEIRGRSFNVASTASFSNGDGLCFLSNDRKLVGFRVNRVEGNRIFPLSMPESLAPGTILYRNNDYAFTTALQKPTSKRKIAVSFTLFASTSKLKLSATDECGRSAEVSAECLLSKAEKPQEENIRRQLEKLGNTIYYMRNLTINTDAFIPSSVLSQLRRNVVEALLSDGSVVRKIHKIPDDESTSSFANAQNHPVDCAVCQYDTPFKYNASNKQSKQYYLKNGIENACAFETDYEDINKSVQSPDLMTCRYCLKHEMGYCTKSGKKTPWKEPLRLCLPDNREFALTFDCKRCEMRVTPYTERDRKTNKRSYFMVLLLLILSFSFGITSCYRDTKGNHEQEILHDALSQNMDQESIDSISFYSSHHFTEGYNFQVYHDSISLLIQQPEEMVNRMVVDSFSVYKGHHVVVGDIRIIPQDMKDSVWVQLATDEGCWGWIHETELLPRVVPVDPISQAIMLFSDGHIIISLIILVLIVVAYLVRFIYKRNAPIVHFRDIPSFYPTLLAINVAASATFYASVQMYAPETWRHFYYHPTLNPFQMPLILSIFISSIWFMVIIAVATVDDVKHNLSLPEALLYLLGLSGVCSLNYIIFSITTLHYIGYPLLLIYIIWAIYRYFSKARKVFYCGECGYRLSGKGNCPKCGAYNI